MTGKGTVRDSAIDRIEASLTVTCLTLVPSSSLSTDFEQFHLAKTWVGLFLTNSFGVLQCSLLERWEKDSLFWG